MAQANILIVEDEAVVAADLADKLERAGYGIIGTASRGEQAIHLAKASYPDLVLMDIRLAGPVDGIITAECLKAFADVPVVFLTAHSDRQTIKRASVTEPYGYILKPFDERDLTTQIEIALYKHQAERRLRDSEARYRALVETAIDSIITVDASGTIRSCNAATERMFGYRRDDIVGRHVSALIPRPTGNEPGPSPFGFAPGPANVVGVWRELKGRRWDGHVFPVEIAISEASIGGEALFTGIVRDVTERKRAEEEIRWRADLLEQAHEAVLVWRMGRGIVYWNQGAVELYGWTREEAAGRPTHVLLRSKLPLPMEEFERSLVAAGKWYGEIEQRKKDDTPVIVESRMVSISDDAGGVLVMETNRDVTERHAAHETLRRFAAELEQRVKERTGELIQSQERLRALTTELNLTEQRERKRLATDLHDHLAQLLVLGRLKLSQAKRMTDVTPDCAALLAQTTEVLDESLTYTRTLVADLSPPVLHDFGLATALKWLGDHMQRHDLSVVVRWSGNEDLRIPEDQTVLLFQSVRELLMNASKHAESDTATVSVDRDDDSLRVEVRDDGKGFDVTSVDNGPTPMSSKFGLFSVRERMAALGGRFHVESSPGAGTRVTLTLPLRSGAKRDELSPGLADGDGAIPVRQPAAHPSLGSQSSGAGLTRIRVLLVDDHAVVRQGLRSLLESYADMEVVGEAGNGLEAVALAEKLKPDVVLMDINMPQMDGVEATGRIKAARPSTIVIGLSMHMSGHYEQKMNEAGAAGYLSKESVADQLHAMILACRQSHKNPSRDGEGAGQGRS